VEIEEAAPGHGGGAAGMSWGLTGLGTSTAEREVEEAGGRDDGFDGSRSRGSWWARVDRGLVVGSSGKTISHQISLLLQLDQLP
jgi:hypothetical protein